MIEVKASGSEGLSFRWGPRDGWKRKVGDGVITLKRGAFVAEMTDWQRVDGEFGTQTRIELDIGGFRCYLWLKGDLVAQINEESGTATAMWRFESIQPVDGKFLILRMEKVDSPPDPGILATLFQDLEVPF